MPSWQVLISNQTTVGSSHLRLATHRVPDAVSDPELDGMVVAARRQHVPHGMPPQIPDCGTVVGVLYLGMRFLRSVARVPRGGGGSGGGTKLPTRDKVSVLQRSMLQVQGNINTQEA